MHAIASQSFQGASPPAGRFGIALVALVVLAAAPVARAQACAGDLNRDGAINGTDLGLLLAAWGPCASCAADLDANGLVDGIDLGVQLHNWGDCVIVPAWATLLEASPSPTVVADPALRAAISATGLAWRVLDTATQVEMLLVPPGTFEMGCIMGSDQYGCASWERPVHQVTLTNAYYLGRYEVTQKQWQARMGSNPSWFWNASALVQASQVPTRPVERVSWNAIQAFLGATGFRLPTEAEWEYACRAGSQGPFHAGSTDDSTLENFAWYSPNSANQTRPVGGKNANDLGFHDMLGNVWEWVNDWYGAYPSGAQTDPTGPASATHRVIRGGSWNFDSYGVRSSARLYSTPSRADVNIGFRVARTP